jgi:hypothetical protein
MLTLNGIKIAPKWVRMETQLSDGVEDFGDVLLYGVVVSQL